MAQAMRIKEAIENMSNGDKTQVVINDIGTKFDDEDGMENTLLVINLDNDGNNISMHLFED